MNLVAKEFISSRTDGDGVLILSQYTGAARELTEALQVNPFDLDQLADVTYEAFRMGEAERRQRMERMRAQVERNTVFEWGLKILEELTRIIPLRTKVDGGGSDDDAVLDLRFRRNPFAYCA
jgi:trehalose 6-phosphate synthase